MSLNFWWVRHGPTHAKTFIGHTDIPADLSDTAKLERLSAFLPPKAAILSSDLVRARATAEAISGSRPRLAHNPALKEMNFGAWEECGFEQVALKYPELSKKFWECPGAAAPPNGESWDDFRQRVNAAILGIAANHAAKDIILVSHFGTILAALQLASGMTSAAAFSFKINNLSVSRISYLRSSNAWQIHSVNHTV